MRAGSSGFTIKPITMSYTTRWRQPASPCYARLRFGITQQQLADILGVSRSLVTMMEQGKRNLPREAKNIYNRLCKKGDELPSHVIMPVKRGRKPKGFSADLPFVPTVSNYSRANFDTKVSLKRRWQLMELGNQSLPSPEAMADQAMPSLNATAGKAKKDPGCNAFTDKLREQKSRLQHFYKLLEFKKEIREQHHILLSARLVGMNKKEDYLKSLGERLTDGRLKKKIEGLTICNNYGQWKLRKELQKWDVVSLVKTEWQMNCIERHIGLTDELIGALTSEAVVRTIEEPYGFGISSLAV